MNNYNNCNGISPTKKAIKDYLCNITNCSSVETVEDFETLRTRHICQGSKIINILDKNTISVQTTKGVVNVEFFLCSMCGKLIINSSSIEIF